MYLFFKKRAKQLLQGALGGINTVHVLSIVCAAFSSWYVVGHT